MSILAVADMRHGNFNSASALSTLMFLMIFAVAFIMVKFLGANVVRTPGNQRKRESDDLRDIGPHGIECANT